MLSHRSFLLDLLERQKLEPVPAPPTPLTTTEPVLIPSASDLSPEDAEELRVRLAIVDDRDADPRLTNKELGRRHGRTEAQVRYYLMVADKEGRDGLVPGERRGGSTMPGEVQSKIVRLYSRWPEAPGPMAVYEHPELQRMVRKMGVVISYRQVQLFVRTLRKDGLITSRRRGRKVMLLEAHRGAPTWLTKITRPLQGVQMDATLADVLVKDRDGKWILKRVWILWAIDVATRCIVAWRICLTDPDAAAVKRLLLDLMSPKDKIRAACEAESAYPCYGIPECILTDRGWSFLAEGVRTACLDFGIAWEVAPGYQPHLKGIVERFQRTVGTRLLHRLPGTTKSNPRERGEGDLNDDVRKRGLTLPQLRRVIGRFVIDGYHNSFHRGIRDFPLKKWEDLVLRYGEPDRIGTDEASQLKLRMLALVKAGARKLQRQGYSLFGEWFTPQIAAPEIGLLLYDPDDVRKVVVLTPAGQYVCDAYLRGYDLSRPIPRDLLRTRPQGPDKARDVAARARITEIIEKAREGADLTRHEATTLEALGDLISAAKADRDDEDDDDDYDGMEVHPLS